MPNPDIPFLSWVKQRVPADPEVRGCWSLVQRGAELGWLDGSEVQELLEHLRARKDFGVEELLFAHVGDRLRVSFLDEVIEARQPR